jgi:S1/P1 Nuclease
LTLLPPLPSWAFDRVGHETIGHIAEDHLSPSAFKRIREIISPNETVASIGYWADEVRPHRRETRPWHFINLPVREEINQTTIHNYCPGNGCVTAQIQINSRLLTDASKSIREKEEALRFLAHFVADLHQPLHCSNDDDKGGNEKLIRFQGKRMNLHALWDRLISNENGENSRVLAAKLKAEITTGKAAAWAEGNELSWCLESYAIAKNTIYKDYQRGGRDLAQINLGNAYYQQMRPIVEEQLKKAGVRLAKFLNQLLGGR